MSKYQGPILPILTRQAHIPWLWVVLMAYPTCAFAMLHNISDSALTFTMRKFISDPALITFLSSAHVAFHFLVAPWAAWKSDQIWTPLGRRKPFLIIGWILLFFALLFVPFAPNIAILAVCIIAYQLCVEFGYAGPWTPLYYEVIPLHQRGRAVIIKRVGAVTTKMVFSFFLIGQFDKVISINWIPIPGGNLHITGEQLIYGFGALMVLLVVIQMLFFVREIKPDHIPEKSRFSPTKYLRTLFGERQWRLLFLLMFCSLLLTDGIGVNQLEPLLLTEQFGYSKQQFGNFYGINMAVEMIIILPIVYLLIDKVDRFRLFQIGMIVSALNPICYWLFIHYVAVNQIPSPHEVLFFKIWHSGVNIAGLLALEPLIFDYVPRHMMGTINSGFLFVRGLLNLIVLNGAGLWVKYVSAWLGHKEKYDYSSSLLYFFFVGVLGIAAAFIFENYRKKGCLVHYAKQEEAEAEAAAAKAQPSAT